MSDLDVGFIRYFVKSVVLVLLLLL